VTFRSRTLYQLSYNGKTRIVRQKLNGDLPITNALPTELQRRNFSNSGGRGRIRTSVARKERQIYSLLPLAARPPVRTRNTPTQARIINGEIPSY
jgi:hypothetical protein